MSQKMQSFILRLDPKEFAWLERQANESGLNRQDYLRKLFREAVIVPCPSAELEPLVEGLKPIEENLKQIEKLFCKTKTIDMVKLDENMVELKKLVTKIIDYDYDKEI
ncbi:MAG: hypothetical protein E7526_05360 [Ruminococcaceae bacterium]|nr:hypothetical protein [Oscillospiraceae bacterium]